MEEDNTGTRGRREGEVRRRRKEDKRKESSIHLQPQCKISESRNTRLTYIWPKNIQTFLVDVLTQSAASSFSPDFIC